MSAVYCKSLLTDVCSSDGFSRLFAVKRRRSGKMKDYFTGPARQCHRCVTNYGNYHTKRSSARQWHCKHQTSAPSLILRRSFTKPFISVAVSQLFRDMRLYSESQSTLLIGKAEKLKDKVSRLESFLYLQMKKWSGLLKFIGLVSVLEAMVWLKATKSRRIPQT